MNLDKQISLYCDVVLNFGRMLRNGASVARSEQPPQNVTLRLGLVCVCVYVWVCKCVCTSVCVFILAVVYISRSVAAYASECCQLYGLQILPANGLRFSQGIRQ